MAKTAKVKNIRKKPESIPALHLRTKKERLAHIKAVVNAPLTRDEKLSASKKISRIVKKDAWSWTTNLMKAAYLVAENSMSLKEIEKETGIKKAKIQAMLSLEGEFSAEVAKQRAAIMLSLRKTSIANKQIRQQVLVDIGDKLIDIVRQRQKQYVNKKHPGVNTGYMQRTVKAIGHGNKTKIVRGWELDQPLIKELKDTMLHLAKEQGEWADKTENAHMVLVRQYGHDISNV